MSPNTSPEVYGEGEVMLLVSERAGQLAYVQERSCELAGSFYCVLSVKRCETVRWKGDDMTRNDACVLAAQLDRHHTHGKDPTAPQIGISASRVPPRV